MIGGDVTYRCLGGNRFEITLTLYQDCLNGERYAIEEDDPAEYAIYQEGASTPFTSGNVPSVTTEIVPPGFSNDCINNFPNTCLRKQVFRFVQELPPSPNGYYIVYQRCCRNAAINNIIAPGGVGVTYFARIPAFSDGQCPNNSAVFNNMPPQIICAANPFVYDFSATDPDADSLTYELCAAHPGGSMMDAIPTGGEISPPPYPSVPYFPPYSATMPMSGFPPLQINPTTGIMTVTPNMMGRFVVTVCANEWRDGAIINTLSRDVQFVVTNCSKAVVANIPQLSEEFNTYIVQCDGYEVKFQNLSTGGMTYFWDLGVPGATSTDFEPTYTYPDTGTYTVKLVVNPGTTCVDSITRLVKVYPTFNTDFTFDGTLCPEDTIQFTDQSTATYKPVNRWKWYFADGDSSELQNPYHVYAKGGDYNVKLISRSEKGCVDTAEHVLKIYPFAPFAGNDTIIVLGYPYQLNAVGGDFYSWEPPDYLSDPLSRTPSVSFPDTGRYTYRVKISTENGCKGSDTINIWVVKDGGILVPSAFSPNGDGVNDVFRPILIGYPRMNFFRIFNRWGQLVFSTSNVFEGWDGTINGQTADIGTFFWDISATDINGKKTQKKGDVILVR